MKTYHWIFFLCLFGICSQAQAQFSLGVKIGPTHSWQDYGAVEIPEDGERHVRGVKAALTAHYRFENNWSLGIEPGFAEKGAACIPGFIVFEGDTKFFLDYVEAPVLVTFHIPLFDNQVELFSKLGYGASFLMGAQREDTPENDEPVTRSNIDLGQNSILNRWDHGAYGTVGIGVNPGKYQIFIEADLYMGFRDAERFNFSQNRSISMNLRVSRELF